MAYLYILSEGDKDELFYQILAERITGQTFDQPSNFRLRNGSNWKTAQAQGRLLLNCVKHWSAQQDIAVILAIDNDRAPGHPGSSPHPRALKGADLRKMPRYLLLLEMVTNALGTNRTEWPVKVAVAIPVEMIESWVLQLCNPTRATLPLFAESNQRSARDYYQGAPPPQLKDLCKFEADALEKPLDEYFWHAAEQDLDAAAAMSPSLKMFVDELKQWTGE
ncbi:MAG: hypothetical protein JWL59_3420 [Chthoniobacteraceae bacterium]|nr:hypothetical protein [Chthoniobacteraceae bacterium]